MGLYPDLGGPDSGPLEPYPVSEAGSLFSHPLKSSYDALALLQNTMLHYPWWNTQYRVFSSESQ